MCIRDSICSGVLISKPTVVSNKPIVIKLATLAPEGTEYYNLLLEMGQRWQEETDGQVMLRIYPNGVVGRESDTIRKMRIGQIQASAMSSIGLADLTDKIQAFTIPMIYRDYDDVEKVKNVMFDDISDGLSESGFKLLFLVDIGWVYWFSVNEIVVPEDLRNAKIYTTAGDYVTVELFKRFGFNAIPVSETDILTGLQTGMINSMQTVPILSLSSGWFALMPNMLDLKWIRDNLDSFKKESPPELLVNLQESSHLPLEDQTLSSSSFLNSTVQILTPYQLGLLVLWT